MSEIYLDPEVFEGLVDSLDGSRLSLDAVRYYPDTRGLRLDCIDELVECIELLNTARFAFVRLQGNDVKALEAIKSDFLKVDRSYSDVLKTGGR